MSRGGGLECLASTAAVPVGADSTSAVPRALVLRRGKDARHAGGVRGDDGASATDATVKKSYAINADGVRGDNVAARWIPRNELILSIAATMNLP